MTRLVVFLLHYNLKILDNFLRKQIFKKKSNNYQEMLPSLSNLNFTFLLSILIWIIDYDK